MKQYEHQPPCPADAIPCENCRFWIRQEKIAMVKQPNGGYQAADFEQAMKLAIDRGEYQQFTANVEFSIKGVCTLLPSHISCTIDHWCRSGKLSPEL